MLKKITAMVMAIALVLTGITYTPQVAEAAVTSGGGSDSWTLVWNDEFNQTVGSAPNTDSWQYDIGTGSSGWGNNEIQYYTNSTSNVYIAETSGTTDGRALAIKAKKESDGTYTSGRIKTLDKQAIRYGRIEARLRVENGQQNGVWPAFWMMGNDINSVGWPNCGEIDIMEHRNAETEIIGTLHWNPIANNASYSEQYAGSETNGQYAYIDTIANWHTYAVEWYEDCMKWFVDGNCYETIYLTDAMAEEFYKEHFILLNLALGSTSTPFTKYITVDSSFTEATMYVDYVRVYQGSDSNFQIRQTTEGVTAAEPTTVSDGYTTCTADVNTNVGQWNYYVGSSWTNAAAKYKGGEDINDFAMKVTASDGTSWGLQAFTNQLAVTAGHTYNYSITMNSDTAGASVLLKDELADSNLVTKTLVSGDNVFSGTYTPASNNMQFMFDLGALTAGTNIKITNVTLTDVTSGSGETETSTEAPSQSTDTDWTIVANSNDVFSYANANNMSVVNVQRPGWASEDGIYMHTSAGIGYITINGSKVGTESMAIDGAGAVIYLSALSAQTSKVCYYSADGTLLASIDIKNANGTGSGETPTEEQTTQEPVTIAPGQPGSSDLAAPTGVSAYNFYAQENGYQILFTEVEGAVSYNVYVDNSTEPVANVAASKEYISAETVADYADGSLHTIYLTSVDSDGNASIKSEAAQVRITKETNSTSDPSDIARIYVVTNSDEQIVKASKTPASLTIIGNDGVVQTVSDSGTIKLRGNSTSLADKPAYNISFSSKKTVMSGSEKGKKWCLLANAFDKTLMRSKLATDLGNALGGVASPDQQYADLYIDGVYQGNYLISEPAENDRAGIEYDDSDTSNEMMFELEVERVEDDQTYYTTGLGVRFVTADPEGLDPSTDRYSKWVSTLATFENALTNTSSDEVLSYINVDSFVDMYIVNELFNTVDFGYSSVKFYIKNDAQGNPIIYGGPLWDFDLSSGNSSVAEARQYDKFRGQEINLWFNYLMKNQTFKDKVIAKFKEMQPTIQNIYKDNKLGKNQIDQIQEAIYNSRVRNYTAVSEGGAGWSETVVDSAENKYYPYSYGTVSPYNTYTYDQHIEYLRTWLQNKNEWMCTQWGIDYTAVDETITISEDIDITGYQMTASLNNIDGSMGFRVVYQAEPTIEDQEYTEIGLVYGLVYGDNPISESDVVYDSDSEYVQSYAATDEGKISVVMGDSATASYYVRTMSCGVADQPDNITTAAYTTKYYVRAYAKLSDGSIVYSDASSYTVYDIADYIYQNHLVSNYRTYEHLYTKILKYVNSDYVEGDFNWDSIIVQ